MMRTALVLVGLLGLFSGCATSSQNTGFGWPRYRLLAQQTTRLTPPKKDRFDASGLLITPTGDLLTVRNNHDSLLYRIEFLPGNEEANLVPLPDCFSTDNLKQLDPSNHAFDCEGIAQDPQGRYYLCEERRRWILRCDPKTGQTERLHIDWTPVQEYFSKIDSNASFEGIAIGNGRLYVANERSDPVIIVVDLSSLKVKKHFEVYPTKSSFFGTHYSDLYWAENKLWVLCRQHRVVLEVDPDTRKVLAEFDYGDIEESLGYRTGLPVGIMEGLAIDATSIWLVTDNNGDPRGRTGHDIRPTLIRCARPDLKGK